MKPIVINVFGDVKKKIEPGAHRICFPGGEIDVQRTSDNEYWIHIHVNTDETGEPPLGHMTRKRGKIIDSRVDYDHTEYLRRYKKGEPTIGYIENCEEAKHIAVRIVTTTAPE